MLLQTQSIMVQLVVRPVASTCIRKYVEELFGTMQVGDAAVLGYMSVNDIESACVYGLSLTHETPGAYSHLEFCGEKHCTS